MATFPGLHATTSELIRSNPSKLAQYTQAQLDELARWPQVNQDLYWLTVNSKRILDSDAEDAVMWGAADFAKKAIANAWGRPELALQELREFSDTRQDFANGREALERMVSIAEFNAKADPRDPKVQAASLMSQTNADIVKRIDERLKTKEQEIVAEVNAERERIGKVEFYGDEETKRKNRESHLEAHEQSVRWRARRQAAIEVAIELGFRPQSVDTPEYKAQKARLEQIRESWERRQESLGVDLSNHESAKRAHAELAELNKKYNEIEGRLNSYIDREKDNQALNALNRDMSQRAVIARYIEVADILKPEERELVMRAIRAGQEGLNREYQVPEGGFSEDNERSTFGATATPKELNDWEISQGRWNKVGNKYLFERIDPGHFEMVTNLLSLARGKVDEPQFWADFWNNLSLSTDRTLGNIPRFIGSSVRTLKHSIFDSEDAYAAFAEQERLDAARNAVLDSVTAPMRYEPGYGVFGDTVIEMTNLLPFWGTLAVGGVVTYLTNGVVNGGAIAANALAMGYAEDARQELLANGADPLTALVAGSTSGVVQSWIERAQALGLIGKGIGSVLYVGGTDVRATIANAFYKRTLKEFGSWKFAQAAFSLGGGMVANGFLEAVEEGLQAGADRFIQDFAITGNPEFRRAIDTGIKEFRDTLPVMMMTAGLGGSVRMTRDVSQAASVGKQLRILTGQGIVGKEAEAALASIGKTMDFAGLREAWRNASSDRARIKLLMDMGHLPKTQATALHAYLVAEEKIADRHDALAMELAIDMSNEGAKTFANNPEAIRRVMTAIGLRNVQVEAAAIGSLNADNTKNERDGWRVTADVGNGRTVTFTIGVMTEQESALDGSAATASSVWQAIGGIPGMTQAEFTKRWMTDEAWRQQVIKEQKLPGRRGESLILKDSSPYIIAEYTTPDGKTRKRKVSAAGAILIATGDHGRRVQAANKTLAHETVHAIVGLLRDTGVLTPETVKALRKEYGDPAHGVDELFNEEVFADALMTEAGYGLEMLERAAGEATRRKQNAVARALRGIADLFMGGGDFVLSRGAEGNITGLTISENADRGAPLARYRNRAVLNSLRPLAQQAADIYNATERTRSLGRLGRIRQGIHERIAKRREEAAKQAETEAERQQRDDELMARVDSDLSQMAEEAFALAQTELNATRVDIEQAAADIREAFKGYDPKADNEAAKVQLKNGQALVAHWRALKNRELKLMRELADLNLDPSDRFHYLEARANEELRLEGRAMREYLDAEKRRIKETPVAEGDALLANTRAIGHVTIESRESYIKRQMAEHDWDRKTAIAQATHLYPENMEDLRAPWANRQLYGGQGSHSPDTAAQALYDDGRIADPTVDAFWDAVRGDIETVGKAKQREIAALEAEAASTLAWGKEQHRQTIADIEAGRTDGARSSIGRGRGYIGNRWSVNAQNAMDRGMRTEAQVAQSLGISYTAWMDNRPFSGNGADNITGVLDENGRDIHVSDLLDLSHEWHHVGRDYNEVTFIDPDEFRDIKSAGDIEDKQDAGLFWLYTRMREYPKQIDKGKLSREEADQALAIEHEMASRWAESVKPSRDAFVRAIASDADVDTLRALGDAFQKAMHEHKLAEDERTKAFLGQIGKPNAYRNERPRRNNGLRSSIAGLYSGGPSVYNRPSLRAIGTNDAGRAYGWGLYATTSREMAEGYAGATWRELANAFRFGGKTYAELTQDDPEAAKLIEGYTATAIAEKRARGYDPEALKRDLQRDHAWLANYLAEPENDPANMATYPQAKQDRLRRFQTRLQNVERLLQADITMTERGTPAVHEQLWWTNRPAGDESHLLTWDARISEENRKRVINAVRSLGLTDEQLAEHFGAKWASTPMTGEQAYGFVTEAIRDLAKLDGDAEALASQLLARHDVDGTFRHFSDGSSIYVAFSDEHLQVVRRWVWDETAEEFALDRSFTPPPPTMDEARKNVAANQAVRSSIGGFGLNANARDEMEKVRKQYEGTDKWMKAPNGQPTKLNERQWLQVRTPSFKAWFGDWENDPANASKVLDKNGEPLVVYHGTYNNDFWSFDPRHTGDNYHGYSAYGGGFYFAMTKKDAKEWAVLGKVKPGHHPDPKKARIIQAFVNIRNPYNSRKPYEPLDPYGLGVTHNPTVNALVQRGHDGVFTGKKVDEVIVFAPEQIKSATDNAGTFDTENPDIRSSIAGPLPTVKRIRGLSNERVPATLHAIAGFAGNKTSIVTNHPRFFRALGNLAREDGGRVIDAFAGIGGYTTSLGALRALPTGSVLNEWSIARYTLHKALAEDPEAVSDAVRDIIGRLESSAEVEAFRNTLNESRAIEDEAQKQAKKKEALVQLVKWFNDELNGKHGVTYVAAPGNSAYGDAQLNENAQTAALYLILQNLSTQSRPINFIWDDKTGTAKIEETDRPLSTSSLSTNTVRDGNYTKESIFGATKYTRRINAVKDSYKGLKVTRRDGWEVARTANKGDVVFVDPAYLGVQAYGGKKGEKLSTDANSAEVAIQKLVNLAKPAIENGFSIVYTNEFSDKSKAKKPGLSQEQYADIWNEAMRQIRQAVGQENASIAYLDRGKKDAADVVIAIGKARDVLEQAIKNVRRDEKPRTQNANRATPSDAPTIANLAAEVNNEVDPQATSARQKDAHGVYPDASGDIARASIGGRRQAEYRGIIAKHRPNLPQAEVDRFMDELGKLGNTKAEKTALHWYVKGTLELPEDEEKLKQTLEMAERFKLDPLQFDSPSALAEEADRRNPKKQKVGYIDPDTVPELTNKRDLGNGLVIYDVEDSEAGQAAMRRIMNSHLGRNANGEYWSPWCLLTPTVSGGVSESAKNYWGVYNRSGRGAAFYKGKLVSFQSSKFPQGPEWWDMEDKSHRQWVPYIETVSAHEVGWDDVPTEAVVQVEKEANHETGEHREIFGIHTKATVGDKQNGVWQLWVLGPTSHYLSEQATYKDGKLDGVVVKFHQTPAPSQINLESYELYKDGEQVEAVFYTPSGTISYRKQKINGQTVCAKYWQGHPEGVTIDLGENTSEDMSVDGNGFPTYVATRTDERKEYREDWNLKERRDEYERRVPANVVINIVNSLDTIYARIFQDGRVESPRSISTLDELKARAREHGVPLTQRTLDRIDAFQRGDLDALRIKDPFEGVPLPDVSAYEQNQGGARSSIGGREVLPMPRENTQEGTDTRSSISGVEKGARAAGLYFGRSPTQADIASRAIIEAGLFASGRKQNADKVIEAYRDIGVTISPEDAAEVADRINTNLEEQKTARARRVKPGEEPRDKVFTLDAILAQAYDENWKKAEKDAFTKGVSGTFGAARQMAQDVQEAMEARRKEAEAVTGTAPAIIETELGFDIEASLLAAPEQIKTKVEIGKQQKQTEEERKAALEEARREDEASGPDGVAPEPTVEQMGFTESKLDEYHQKRRELRERSRKVEEEYEEKRKEAKKKYQKKETDDKQNAKEEEDNYLEFCESLRVSLNGIAFDLDNPPSVREFVNCMIHFVAEQRAGKKITRLRELREAFADPLVVRDAARTLAQIAEDLANRLVPSAARELIVKKAMTLAAAETIGQVRALATGALLSIRNVRIRQGRTELRDAMVKMIQRVKGRGRTVVGKEDSERKVSGDLERWLEDIEKALTLGEAALESMRTAAYATIVGLSEHGKTQKELVDFRDYMKAMRTISAIDKFGAWRHMTLAGLDDLRVELERMINGGLEAHERKMRQMEAKIDGFVQPLIDAMTQHAPDFKPDENAPLRERIANALDRHLGLQSLLFEALIGKSTGETRQKAQRAVRDLLNEFSAASAKYEATLLAWRAEIQDIIIRNYGSTRAFMERMHTPVPEDLRAHLTNRRTDAQEQAGREARQKTRITYGQALQLYASLVQRDYAQNARIHHRDGADFDALRRNLTDADVAFIAECSRFMRRIFPDLQAEYAEVTGVTVGTTPNYWPVKIDYPRSGLPAEVRAWTPIVAAMEPRRRNGLDFKEEVSAEQMLFSRLDEWARMLAYGKLGIISAAVFGNGDVINAITNSIGTKMALRIQENIKTALMGPATKGDNFAILSTRWASAFAMAANAGVAFKQGAGIPNFALKLGTKETVAAWWGGVTRLADDEWDADWAILTASDSYKARYGGAGLNAEMRAALHGATPGAIGGATAKAYDFGFRLQSVADRVVAKPFAIHAFRMYREAYLREGLTAEEAQRRAVIDAWALVEDTQQSARPENQLQSVNTSRIMRMLVQFRTSQLQQLQWEMRAWAAFLRGEEGARQKLGRVIFINHILAPLFWTAFDVIWQAWLGLFGPGDDEDGEKMEKRRERRIAQWIGDLALGAILGQLTAVPVLGGAAEAAYNTIVQNIRRKAEGKEPRQMTTTEVATAMTEVPAIRNAADIAATVYNLGLAVSEVELRDVASEADDFLKTAIPPYRDASKAAEQWGLGDFDNLWEEEE